jgi:hypothetical protein
MRTALAITLTLALAACASGPGMRDGGLATYDALRAGQSACAAKGGTFRLKSGGDSKYLDDYACERN